MYFNGVACDHGPREGSNWALHPEVVDLNALVPAAGVEDVFLERIELEAEDAVGMAWKHWPFVQRAH